MFQGLITIGIIGIFIVIYLNKKQFALTLPYLITILVMVIYGILDSYILVKVFGCGCVPSAQTNMLNIALNSNDLKAIVYGILVIAMCILSIFLSKNLESKLQKVVYVIGTLAFNCILAFQIYMVTMWL